MRKLLTTRRLVTAAGLLVAWCALWGEATIANLASGVAIVVPVMALDIGTPGQGGVRAVPVLRLLALVLVDLVRSTLGVAREILTPTDHTEEAVIAVPVPIDTRTHLLLLVVAVTVTPGTAVVDADTDEGVLYVHLLHEQRRAAVATYVGELARLACLALPVESGQSDKADETP